MQTNVEDREADIRRPQSFDLVDHVGRDDESPFSGSTKRRLAQASRQHGAISASPLLHDRFRATRRRQHPTVSFTKRVRVDHANVLGQEHDGRV